MVDAITIQKTWCFNWIHLHLADVIMLNQVNFIRKTIWQFIACVFQLVFHWNVNVFSVQTNHASYWFYLLAFILINYNLIYMLVLN